MQKEQLVSIVVPVYNMGSGIEKCLNSILSQSYCDIEVIVVDDGSTDDSYQICEKISKNDSRLKVFHTKNQGSGPARNYGISKAMGKYIYFPDADDFLINDAVLKLVDAMDNGKYDLVVFGYKEITSLGKVKRIKKYPCFSNDAQVIRNDYSDYFGVTSKFNIQGAPWNKFFNLNLIKKFNISYPNLRRHQDEVFISRYMCYAKNARFVDDILYTHYTNDLKAEWKKYPVDYIDSVIGLYESRKDTILKWNSLDDAILNKVEIEYVCNVIKALELSFSPKMKLNKHARISWIKSKIKLTNIEIFVNIVGLGHYQHFVLYLINKNYIRILYLVFKLKIGFESTKLYKYIRNK